MPRILIKFSKIKLDKARFTKRIADEMIFAMRVTGYKAFELSYRLVPVWSGESRGGLRGIALQLELGDPSPGVKSGLYEKLMASIIPIDTKRVNKDGKRKTPTSAHSTAEGPVRRRGNRIDFSFTNDAEGFTYGDKRPLKNSLNAPFNFSKFFLQEWRRRLKLFLENRPDIPVKSFSAIQRVSVHR